MDKLKKIEAFSEKYRNLLTSETLAFRESGSWGKVRQDWWLALIFFFDRAFYQGRNDKISSYFEQATIKAMGSVLTGASSEERLSSLKTLSHWLDPEKWRSQGNPLWDAFCKKYDIDEGKKSGTGRERDREMVLSSLSFIVNHCDNCNILEHSIQHIQNGEIITLSDELHNIVSVGDKIASFFLRDTVFVYNLETYLKPEDYYYVLPVDTWVRKVADKLGIEANAKAIAIACQQNGVSPIKFDQGAWYLGSHSFSELLDML
jgi:hypothetical protein